MATIVPLTVIAVMTLGAPSSELIHPYRGPARPDGPTLGEKHGRIRMHVVRATVRDHRIASTASIGDFELSENIEERSSQLEHADEHRWMALIEVEVNRWVRGHGTYGDEPRDIVLLRGVAPTVVGSSARRLPSATLSTDETNTAFLDNLPVGSEFEFHIVRETLYGRYYGLVAAFQVVDGAVLDREALGHDLKREGWFNWGSELNRRR